MTDDERQEHERRLQEMASGKHEGPLTSEDVAALKVAYEVYEAARLASRKLWTMLVRGEVESRYELDELVGMFNGEHPFNARMRLAAERGKAPPAVFLADIGPIEPSTLPSVPSVPSVLQSVEVEGLQCGLVLMSVADSFEYAHLLPAAGRDELLARLHDVFMRGSQGVRLVPKGGGQ